MKILVTGASGFLGHALVNRLLIHEYRDLRLFVRNSSSTDRLSEIVNKYNATSVEIFVGSLENSEHVDRAIEGVDFIYHLVASGSGGHSEVFQGTVDTSKFLLAGLVRVPKARRPRVVLVSSFGVYGVASLPRGSVVDEDTLVEPYPERRDIYSHAKILQERLFWECREEHGLPLVVVRPGVIYGPEMKSISPRVGLNVSGVFFDLGGDNLLPLTYVENCAEAIVIAGASPLADGQIYNAVDDDLPRCNEYLSLAAKYASRRTTLRVPYFATRLVSYLNVFLHKIAPRKIPAFFTPYKVSASWGGNRFKNDKLKSLGYLPVVSTSEGLDKAFSKPTAVN